MVCAAYRDKKVVSVFVRFSCAASLKDITGKMNESEGLLMICSFDS
jgi:hypothetical protein